MIRPVAAALLLCCCARFLAAQGVPPPAPAPLRCTVDKTPPTAADLLLEQEKFKEAGEAYNAVLATTTENGDARLGLVRVLIGENQVKEAQAAADAFAKAQPKSGLAEVAEAEALYRAGDVEGSFTHAKRALQMAPCDGRSSLAVARLYTLTGLHGRAATLRVQAHRLRPTDQTVTELWIQTLPRAQRLKELKSFLEQKPALSDDDARSMNTEVKYLEARRPGECRVTSAADHTQAVMQPIYGDHSYPVAFGLDTLFDGKRRRMQIDTGAGGIVLTENAARGLGLQSEFAVKTGGIGDEGRRDSFLSHVHSIRIGDVELQDCMVEVVSKAKLDVDGLIGMDVFRRWLVTLDYQAAQLRLAPLPQRPDEKTTAANQDGTVEDETPKDRYVAPEMKDWLSVARIGHSILLPTVLKPDAPMHYMIMDTGAQMSTLSVVLAREAGKLHSSSVEFHGISGKANKTFETDSTELLIGNLRLAPQPYFAFDITNISHDMEFEMGGLSGLSTLQRLMIEIDYRDNLLKLTYDRKRDRIRF